MKNKAGHSIWFVRKFGILLSPITFEGFVVLLGGVALVLGLPVLGDGLSRHGGDPALGAALSLAGFLAMFVTYGIAALHSAPRSPY